MLDFSRFHQDLWIDWRAPNTPAHREHFVAGSVSRFTWQWLTVPAVVVVDHYGGEQYAVAGDPVRRNVAGGLGAVVRFEPAVRWLDEAGGELWGFGSATEANRGEGGYQTGGGVRVGAWVRTFGVRVGLDFFRGEGFTCWEGDPLYRTERPWYALSVGYRLAHACGMTVDTGPRLDCVDAAITDYFDSTQHRIWLSAVSVAGVVCAIRGAGVSVGTCVLLGNGVLAAESRGPWWLAKG